MSISEFSINLSAEDVKSFSRIFLRNFVESNTRESLHVRMLVFDSLFLSWLRKNNEIISQAHSTCFEGPVLIDQVVYRDNSRLEIFFMCKHKRQMTFVGSVDHEGLLSVNIFKKIDIFTMCVGGIFILRLFLFNVKYS